MFKLETHMHTSESSACATISAKDQVLQYINAGYDGILVTDHFVNGNSAVDRSLPWKEQMHHQFAGYRAAKEAAKDLNLKVFLGIEYAYHGTEFLVIGLGEDYFVEHEELKDAKPDEFLPAFAEAGAAIIQAHPFREASYISEIRLYPNLVDAIEGFNYSNHDDWNQKAIALALGCDKPITAGSDCHHAGGAHAGISLEKNIETTQDLISVIKSGEGFIYFEQI